MRDARGSMIKLATVMWILKGSMLGLVIFAVGLTAFLSVTLFAGPSHATGLSALRAYTWGNPFFWTALLGCLLVGISLVASWPVKVT